jgi:exopolysaccharide production protein ExoQ
MLLLAFLPEISTSLLLMMMGTQLPQIGALLILAEIGMVGLLFIFRTTTFIDVLLRWWWLLLFPILCVLSALWSEVPMVSFRYASQFLFTCFVGVLLARLLPPRRYVIVLMISLFIFCILCILNGRLGSSFGRWVLIGLTGSKNQMGYAAQLLMLSGVAVLLMRGIIPQIKVIALAALPLSVYLVAGTDSSTAILMSFGGTFVLAALWFSERLPPGGRLGTLFAGALILAPITLLLPEIHAFINHFVFDTLGKDPTLTGRTLLWERADALIERKPLLGYGFQAIWMGDSVDTIGLKRLADIEDGRQFHFHNHFRIAAVDTGLIGLATFVGVMIACGFGALRQVLLRPAVETSFFAILFALMVARAFTDQIIGPFNMHTLLYFACCVYAFWKPEQAPQPAAFPQFSRRGAPARAH